MSGIFISYRRGDAAGMAGRIFDRLKQSFSSAHIFMDVDGLKGGVDFVTQLEANLAQCSVLIAVIGPTWLDAKDASGTRRLDGEHDFVRREIVTALQRQIPLLPLLLDGAQMPSEDQLPEDLKPLARRQALELRHSRFSADAKALVETLTAMLPRQHRPSFGLWSATGAAVLLSSIILLAVKKPDLFSWRPKVVPDNHIVSVQFENAERAAEMEAKKRGEVWRRHTTPETQRLFEDGYKYDFGEGVPKDYDKARLLYEKAVGHPAAILALGMLYDFGQGVSKDESKAREFYQTCAKLDHPACMKYLAIDLRDGTGGPQDAAGAREWFGKASDMAYHDATNSLALMVRDGIGGPSDPTRARKLFELAVKRGNGYSFLSLARMLDHGEGGTADPRAAAVWLMEGSHILGSPGDGVRKQLTGQMSDFSEATRKAVQHELSDLGLYTGPIDGLWSPGTRRAAERYVEKNTPSPVTAAKPDATAALATSPQHPSLPGTNDVRSAEIEAKKLGGAWREKTTPETNRLTMEGDKYYSGKGVPVDYGKAREFYEKADGHPGAICQLGILEALGQGSEKNGAKAREFFEKSASLGYPKCMRYLGIFLRQGEGGPSDLTKAREWFDNAVARGDATSAAELGKMMRDGLGGPADPARARGLLDLAIRRGSVVAYGNLAYALDRGLVGPADPMEAARYLMLAPGLVGTEGEWSRSQLTGQMAAFSEATRKTVQKEFADLSLYSGPLDGLWTATTQHAAEAYLEKYVKPLTK